MAMIIYRAPHYTVLAQYEEGKWASFDDTNVTAVCMHVSAETGNVTFTKEASSTTVPHRMNVVSVVYVSDRLDEAGRSDLNAPDNLQSLYEAQYAAECDRWKQKSAQLKPLAEKFRQNLQVGVAEQRNEEKEELFTHVWVVMNCPNVVWLGGDSRSSELDRQRKRPGR